MLVTTPPMASAGITAVEAGESALSAKLKATTAITLADNACFSRPMLHLIRVARELPRLLRMLTVVTDRIRLADAHVNVLAPPSRAPI